jgi:peroxiredoxin/outer membrane lipoprotein-sorting protein
MKLRRKLPGYAGSRLVLAIFCISWPTLVLDGSSVLAQGQPAAPPMRRASQKPIGLSAEMEAFLTKLIATYQSASSYRDRGHVKLVQQAGRVKTTTEMPMELSFKRPNLLWLDGGQYSAACDGKTLHFVIPAMQQYTVQPAPGKLEKEHLLGGSTLGGTEEGHPEIIDFLFGQDPYRMLVSQVVKIAWQPDQIVAGKGCRVLQYDTLHDTKVTLIVETNRMLIVEVRAQSIPPASGGSSAIAREPAFGEATLHYEFGTVELNPALEESVFAYKPPKDFRRVSSFDSGAGQSLLHEPDGALTPSGQPTGEGQFGNQELRTGKAVEGQHLLNKPAPPVSGKTLEGKPVGEADLRGKVVLLFFWALSGGEYSLTSISTVQSVANHFKDRPDLFVLGVNSDSGKADVVAQLMARKKATFRTLADDDQQITASYELGGVPTFIVVNQEGLVTWAKLGAPPTLKEDLIQQIGKLLPVTK